ncbi:interferon-induced protein with tetratricopeptide repeats 1B-like [Ptychodera flava]|uniref:interferon-induced protein with tetratricopeptide repeats 1B-like n=1 Tax=Ptychodera flava TaxID=63121 RepID=UPI00396A3AC9
MAHSGECKGAVAVEIDEISDWTEEMTCGLVKLLGGDGTFLLTIKNSRVLTIMMTMSKVDILSDFLSQKSQFLSDLGISKLLILDEQQLHSVRSTASSCSFAYDSHKLQNLVEERGIDLTLASVACKDPDISSSVRLKYRNILQRISQDDNLYLVSLILDEREKYQQLHTAYKILENEKGGIESTFKGQFCNQERENMKLLHENVALRRRHDTLYREIGNIQPPNAERQRVESKNDAYAELFRWNIQDIPFDADQEVRMALLRTKLEKLPCHFTWHLEDKSDFSVKLLMMEAEILLNHHKEMSPVPHQAMLGYLCLCKRQPVDQRNYDFAVACFDKALQYTEQQLVGRPDNTGPVGNKLVLLANKAWAYFNAGYDMDKLATLLTEIENLLHKKLTKLQMAYIDGHRGQALCYFLQGSCDQGIETLQRALEVFPEQTDWLTWHGYLLEAKRSRVDNTQSAESLQLLSRAVTSYERVISINQDHSLARAWLAEALTESDRREDARAQVEKARQLNSSSPHVLISASDYEYANNNLDGAEAILKKALEVNPDYPYTLSRLGDIQKQLYMDTPESTGFSEAVQQYLMKALEYYDDALRSSVDTVFSIALSRAYIYRLLGESSSFPVYFTKAEEAYLQLLKSASDPYNRSQACFGLAYLYKGLHDQKKFLKFLKQALVGEGAVFWCERKAVEKIIEFEREKINMSGHRKKKSALLELAAMHCKLRDFKSACEFYQEAVQISSYNSWKRPSRRLLSRPKRVQFS